MTEGQFRNARSVGDGWLFQSMLEVFLFTRTDELRQHNCWEAVLTIEYGK